MLALGRYLRAGIPSFNIGQDVCHNIKSIYYFLKKTVRKFQQSYPGTAKNIESEKQENLWVRLIYVIRVYLKIWWKLTGDIQGGNDIACYTVRKTNFAINLKYWRKIFMPFYTLEQGVKYVQS